MQILKQSSDFIYTSKVFRCTNILLNTLAGGIIFCECGRYLKIAGKRTPQL